MAKIFINVIESSSKGNCIVLFDGKTNLILDFGTDSKNIERFFVINKIESHNIACCLITHAHHDHICSIGKKVSENILFYCTKETKEHLKNKCINKNILTNIKVVDDSCRKWVKVPKTNWKFKTIPTLHNISGSVCFVIKNKNKKLLYLTDTEFFENKLFKKMNCYIVESNYGTSKLETKAESNKHIENKQNHMSIDDAEKFLNTYYSKKTNLFIFSHISINGCKEKEYIENLIRILNSQNINAKYINPYQIMKFKDSF